MEAVTQRTITVNESWMKAIERAKAAGLKATLLGDGSTFRVPSKSKPGTFHFLPTNKKTGQILDCSDCYAYSMNRVCSHQGSVLAAQSALQSFEIFYPKAVEPSADGNVRQFIPRRGQLYRTAR